MKKLTKVKDHPHLYRDEETGAIINYDTILQSKIEEDRKSKVS